MKRSWLERDDEEAKLIRAAWAARAWMDGFDAAMRHRQQQEQLDEPDVAFDLDVAATLAVWRGMQTSPWDTSGRTRIFAESDHEAWVGLVASLSLVPPVTTREDA